MGDPKVDAPRDLLEFYESEYPHLVGTLGLLTGDVHVAEELAQETLARVWTQWNKVRRLDQPRMWARRVALNLVASRYRRFLAERRASVRIGSDVVARQPDLNERHDVRLAVAALPKRQRTAVVLRFYLDLSFAEVADLMNVPESTAKTLTRRGLARLRQDGGLANLKGVWDDA